MHRPAGVGQDGIDEVVGVVQSVSLVGLRDRPEQQPADRLPREFALPGDHGVMDITAIAGSHVMETAPTTTISLHVVRRMLWPAIAVRAPAAENCLHYHVPFAKHRLTAFRRRIPARARGSGRLR
jgi:hypothetical protein